MRYSLRTLAEIITVAAFILALVIAWRARPAPTPGRYQLFMSDGTTMVLDTATGQLWSRPANSVKFYDVMTPWTEEP
jgi:hypothetical protein